MGIDEDDRCHLLIGDDDGNCGSNLQQKQEQKQQPEWRRRMLANQKRRRQRDQLIGRGMCCLVVSWVLCQLLVSLLLFVRLSKYFDILAQPRLVYNVVYTPLRVAYQRSHKDSSDCMKNIMHAENWVLQQIRSQSSYCTAATADASSPDATEMKNQLFGFDGGKCRPLIVGGLDSGISCVNDDGLNLFESKDECYYVCQPNSYYTYYAAPVGAYLMIAGLLLSFPALFAFICLPFDSNKARLRTRLHRWLCMDFLVILTVAAMMFGGAILMISHELLSSTSDVGDVTGSNNDVTMTMTSLNKEYKFLWGLCLLLSPCVVLAFHLYFWRRVYRIQQSIDLSKSAISGVWSTKI